MLIMGEGFFSTAKLALLPSFYLSSQKKEGHRNHPDFLSGPMCAPPLTLMEQGLRNSRMRKGSDMGQIKRKAGLDLNPRVNLNCDLKTYA